MKSSERTEPVGFNPGQLGKSIGIDGRDEEGAGQRLLERIDA